MLRKAVDRARSLRREMSLPEVLLWEGVRAGRLEGLKFRRQHPFGRYVLDFYCPAAHLAVEIDGYVHDTGSNPQRDQVRDAWMAARGVRTLRLPASDVLASVEGALDSILAEALRTSPSGPSGHLPPQGEDLEP